MTCFVAEIACKTILQDVMEENAVELVIECLARNKYVPSLQAEGCRFLEVSRRPGTGAVIAASESGKP